MQQRIQGLQVLPAQDSPAQSKLPCRHSRGCLLFSQRPVFNRRLGRFRGIRAIPTEQS